MSGNLPPAAEAHPDAALVGEICTALRQVAGRFGLDIGDEPRPDDAARQTKTDPFSGESSLRLVWEGKARNGEVNFFPDGRIFAEYQVLLALPGDAEHYVEAVQVWGRSGALKSDAVIGQFAG
jgi:hypothetical protein